MSVLEFQRSGTILLVDDEETILNVFSRVLQRMSFNVLTARNGLEAVEIFQTSRADITLVIMDFMMPEMNGGQACGTMYNIDPNVKVLLASGHTVECQVQEAMKQGCIGFLQKPFGAEDLKMKIMEVI